MTDAPAPVEAIADLLDSGTAEPWERAALEALRRYLDGGGALTPHQRERMERIGRNIRGRSNGNE